MQLKFIGSDLPKNLSIAMRGEFACTKEYGKKLMMDHPGMFAIIESGKEFAAGSNKKYKKQTSFKSK